MADIEVRRMASDDRAAVVAYLEGEPSALLYHSVPYVELVASLTGASDATLVAVDAAGLVLGVLPALTVDGPFGRVVNSLPFYGSHGGPVTGDAVVRRSLLEAYDRLATDPAVAAATLVEHPLEPLADDEVPRHTHTDARIGQMTPLAYEERHAEQLMASYHSKARNMVRKAAGTGMTVTVDNDAFEFLERVHGENMADIGGRPKPHAFFAEVARRFRADDDYRIWVASIGGEPVAALLVLYFGTVAEYFTPVVREQHRSLQPMSLLVHDGMTDASERGYRWWNWGGTWASQEGVHRFKKRWGTRDEPYRYFVQVNRPELLRAAPEELLAGYPDFFTVPFSALVPGG